MSLGWAGVCHLAVFPQAVPSQGADESKDGTHYLRDVVVEKGKTVERLVCVLCSVFVRGEVKGDVVTVWGNIEIESKLQGDAVAAGGKIVIRGEVAAEGEGAEPLVAARPPHRHGPGCLTPRSLANRCRAYPGLVWPLGSPARLRKDASNWSDSA